MDEMKMIALVKKYYKLCKRKLFEQEMGLAQYKRDEIIKINQSVIILEKIIIFMDDTDRLIIENEVLKDKKGRWYENYMSTSTYYRRRKKAYINYINLLNK